MSGTWQHGGLAAGALREERAANADLLHRRRRWSAPPEKFCNRSVSSIHTITFLDNGTHIRSELR